jgi:hypothetical protein
VGTPSAEVVVRANSGAIAATSPRF